MDARVVLQLPRVAPPNAIAPCKPANTDIDTEQQQQTLLSFVDTNVPVVTSSPVQVAALRRLKLLFASWVRDTLGLPDVAAALPRFAMFLAGSYRMGTHAADGDIDCVIVTDASISRSAVFSGFAGYLAQTPGIDDLQVLAGARVPLLGFTLDGQEFDVMTCHLREAVLPPRDALLSSYEWMNGLDEASVLSFNGPRLTELLLHTFCSSAHGVAQEALVAIRFLRHWAKARGVYSNKAGFFGGVNLSLMVLYATQTSAVAVPTAQQLVQNVFATFSGWLWGDAPVRVDEALVQTCPLWLQRYEWTGDKREPMVMLTPCFPRFNSMAAATPYSRDELVRELRAAASAGSNWASMCVPVTETVFAAASRFIRIRVHAPDSPSGRLWLGFVQSQVRHLVWLLKREKLGIVHFRFMPVWVEGYHVKEREGEGGSDERTRRHEVAKHTYIAATPDNKLRTHVLPGSLSTPLRHFLDSYIAANQTLLWPTGADVAVDYVDRATLHADVADYEAASTVLFGTKAAAFENTKGVVATAAALTQARRLAEKQASKVMFPARGAVQAAQAVQAAPVQHQQHYSPSRHALTLSAQWQPRPTPPTVTRLLYVRGRLQPAESIYIGPPWRQFKTPLLPVFAPPPATMSLAVYKAQLCRAARRVPAVMAALKALSHQCLGCWCSDPDACHGTVIAAVFKELVLAEVSAVPTPPPAQLRPASLATTPGLSPSLPPRLTPEPQSTASAGFDCSGVDCGVTKTEAATTTPAVPLPAKREGAESKPSTKGKRHRGGGGRGGEFHDGRRQQQQQRRRQRARHHPSQ